MIVKNVGCCKHHATYPKPMQCFFLNTHRANGEDHRRSCEARLAYCQGESLSRFITLFGSILRYKIVHALEKESKKAGNQTNKHKSNRSSDMRYFQRQASNGTRRAKFPTTRIGDLNCLRECLIVEEASLQAYI